MFNGNILWFDIERNFFLRYPNQYTFGNFVRVFKSELRNSREESSCARQDLSFLKLQYMCDQHVDHIFDGLMKLENIKFSNTFLSFYQKLTDQGLGFVKINCVGASYIHSSILIYKK